MFLNIFTCQGHFVQKRCHGPCGVCQFLFSLHVQFFCTYFSVESKQVFVHVLMVSFSLCWVLLWPWYTCWLWLIFVPKWLIHCARPLSSDLGQLLVSKGSGKRLECIGRPRNSVHLFYWFIDCFQVSCSANNCWSQIFPKVEMIVWGMDACRVCLMDGILYVLFKMDLSLYLMWSERAQAIHSDRVHPKPAEAIAVHFLRHLHTSVNPHRITLPS